MPKRHDRTPRDKPAPKKKDIEEKGAKVENPGLKVRLSQQLSNMFKEHLYL